MSSEKNQLVELTVSQSDCYRAMPEDFVISSDGQPHFGGQHNEKLLKEARDVRGKSKPTGKGQPRATRPDDAGKPHTP